MFQTRKKEEKQTKLKQQTEYISHICFTVIKYCFRTNASQNSFHIQLMSVYMILLRRNLNFHLSTWFSACPEFLVANLLLILSIWCHFWAWDFFHRLIEQSYVKCKPYDVKVFAVSIIILIIMFSHFWFLNTSRHDVNSSLHWKCLAFQYWLQCCLCMYFPII